MRAPRTVIRVVCLSEAHFLLFFGHGGDIVSCADECVPFLISGFFPVVDIELHASYGSCHDRRPIVQAGVLTLPKAHVVLIKAIQAVRMIILHRQLRRNAWFELVEEATISLP